MAIFIIEITDIQFLERYMQYAKRQLRFVGGVIDDAFIIYSWH